MAGATTFSLRIAARPRDVFDYLVEPRNRPQWQSSLRGVEVLDPGPARVGTRWIDRTAIGARPHLRIAELRAPQEAPEPAEPGTYAEPGAPGIWREVGDWHGLGVDLALVFEPTDRAGTLLHASVELHSTGRWLPVRLVLRALAPVAVRSDLRRAARILESA